MKTVAPSSVEGLDDPRRVEARLEEEREAVHEHAGDAEGEAVDVEERQREDEPVLGREAPEPGDGRRVVRERAIRQRDALALPRRARGVDEHGDVVVARTERGRRRGREEFS